MACVFLGESENGFVISEHSESLSKVDSSVTLMRHDPNDLRSQIRFRILQKKHTPWMLFQKILPLFNGDHNHVVSRANGKKKTKQQQQHLKFFFSFFFSEYACVTFWNNTSFSFIHQAGNIPSHLFHIPHVSTFKS